MSKINATGSSVVYSTYLGDDGAERAWAVAVGGDGTAYVTGQTSSDEFPRVNAYDSTYNGGDDAFVTVVSADGSTLLYSTYLGGDENETGFGIAVDANDTVYVTGRTVSIDFPTEQPFQDESASNQPLSDAFVTALAPGGGSLVYSTFLGGDGVDWGTGIAVDATGHASVIGYTSSTDFPTVPVLKPLQADFGGVVDAFVTTFHPNGRTVMQSTYLGGAGYDIANAVAIGRTVRPAPDPDQTETLIDGIVHIAGTARSTDFPTVNPSQRDNAGGDDAFMSTLTPYPHGTTSYYIGNTSQSAMYDLGCARGITDSLYPGADDSLVALFFGRPASSAELGAGNFGTRLLNNNFITTVLIAEAAQAFGQGYWECSPDTYELTLAVSTSNFTLSTGDDNVVTFEHGAAWATMINAINDWLETNDYGNRVRAVGGNDIEIAWNTPEASRAWVDGYVSEALWSMYNLGDAQACPPVGGPTCDNGWSVEDVWYVSYGATRVRAVPQIYVTDGIQAQQWYELAVYSSEVQDEKMFFEGVLTQYQACRDRGDYYLDGVYNPASVCRSGDLAPEQAWVSLWDLLNDDPRTEQELRWSTDVRWDYFIEEY
ncbi:MAG: SBBP repeat-containing protein [Chloroflexota bacterium]